MRGVLLQGPGQVEVVERPMPTIEAPTDAIIEVAAACVCGSDLWPYRGIDLSEPRPMGHEYVGTVVEVGPTVTDIKVGDFVVGSFCISDNTCEICQSGYPSRCVNGGFMGDTQAQYTRVPFADGMLVPVPGGRPDSDVVASLLAASDVLGTGWFGADAAQVGPGKTVAVVGDGAVGLLAVLAAKEMGADRIIAMSRHESRANLAREFGATDVVAERGEEGIAKIKELTNGLGAHSVVEAVGTQESMLQAIGSCRPGGHVGFVGVSHDVSLDGGLLFITQVHLHGGPAPVRKYLPNLVERIVSGAINPGKVFDLTVPLDRAAKAYAAMDKREAIKALLSM